MGTILINEEIEVENMENRDSIKAINNLVNSSRAKENSRKLKSKSSTYQLNLSNSEVQAIARSVKSALPSPLQTTGKVIVHLHLGGVQAIELEIKERF